MLYALMECVATESHKRDAMIRAMVAQTDEQTVYGHFSFLEKHLLVRSAPFGPSIATRTDFNWIGKSYLTPIGRDAYIDMAGAIRIGTKSADLAWLARLAPVVRRDSRL